MGLTSALERRDNFLFKNTKNFEIHKKFKKLCRFEILILEKFKNLGISEICLISLYVCKGIVKGNQANLRNPQKNQNFQNQNFKSTQLFEFFMDFKKLYIFEEEIIPS